MIKQDLRLFELDLVSDVDVLVGLVLELLDETVRFFLGYSICFQSPALHDLENLCRGLVRQTMRNQARSELTARESISLEAL